MIDCDEDIVNFALMDDLNEMMDKSGCDVILTVSFSLCDAQIYRKFGCGWVTPIAPFEL